MQRERFGRQPFLVERHVRRFNRQMAPGGHGVARVQYEIDEDLLHLARIGLDRQQRLLQLRRGVDVLSNDARQHLQEA